MDQVLEAALRRRPKPLDGRPTDDRRGRRRAGASRSPRPASGGPPSRRPTSRRSSCRAAPGRPSERPGRRARRGDARSASDRATVRSPGRRSAPGATMEYRDYYEILGRASVGHQAEIKKAFRKLAREHHPGPEPRRQGRREAVQGRQRGERRPLRPGQAQAVRPARRQLGPVPARRRRPRRRGPVRAGRPVRRASAGRRGRPGGAARRATSATSSGRAGGGDAGFSDFFRMFFSGAAAGAAATGRATRPPSGRRAGPAAGPVVRGHPRRDGPRRTAPGAAGRRPGAAARTAPSTAEIEAPAELTLEEAFHGTKRLRRGRGQALRGHRSRAASTPAAASGCRGKGPNGRDVVVTVRRRARTTLYTRRGADLERELPVTLARGAARRGGAGRHPQGPDPAHDPGRAPRPGGRSASPARACRRLKGDGTGDLYVKVRVVLPTDARRRGPRGRAGPSSTSSTSPTPAPTT